MHIMFKLLFFITISLSMQSVGAVVEADVAGVQQNVRPAPLPPAYPKWSERAAPRVAVPGPPSGPYMSTGLSETGRGFRCCEKRNTRQMPSQLFKEMPWPERRRPPQQWQPENGQYSYAPANVSGSRSGQDPMTSGGYGNRAMPAPQWQPMYQRPPQYRYR